MLRITFFLSTVLLLILPANGADEIREIEGPGLIGNDSVSAEVKSFEKIGITPVTPNRLIEDKVARESDPLAVSVFREFSTLGIADLTKSGTFGVRKMFYNRSKSLHLLNPEKIVAAGIEHDVDAFWGAALRQYEDKHSHVKLKLETFLYSAKSGKRVWERTFYLEQFGGGFSQAYEDIVEWSISVLAEDGIGNLRESGALEQDE
jgi:hypothetical protein